MKLAIGLRDICDDLVQRKLRDVNDFEWQRFPRIYSYYNLTVTEHSFAADPKSQASKIVDDLCVPFPPIHTYVALSVYRLCAILSYLYSTYMHVYTYGPCSTSSTWGAPSVHTLFGGGSALCLRIHRMSELSCIHLKILQLHCSPHPGSVKV